MKKLLLVSGIILALVLFSGCPIISNLDKVKELISTDQNQSVDQNQGQTDLNKLPETDENKGSQPEQPDQPQLPEGTKSCERDEDCNDNDPSTFDNCHGMPKKCSNAKITKCKNDDGYCPGQCIERNDSDCKEKECIGNIDCDDAKPETKDACKDNKCSHSEIMECVSEDKYCPKNCFAPTDLDCPEKPCSNDSECDDKDFSTSDKCDVETGKCANPKITICHDNDFYCPEGCDLSSDSDCVPPKPCSIDIDCDDGEISTADVCLDFLCKYKKIADCISGDGYCPKGCNKDKDTDCLDKECETDEDCDDGLVYTDDWCFGNPRKCYHKRIVECRKGDGYCPYGCKFEEDDDCDECGKKAEVECPPGFKCYGVERKICVPE